MLMSKAVLVSTAGLIAPSYAQASAAGPSDTAVGGAIFLIALIVLVLFIYIIPSVVAFGRKHPNRWAILAVNVVFGGTGIGWLGSLVWACNAVHLSPTGNNGGESGLNLFVNDAAAATPPAIGVPQSARRVATPSERLDQLQRLLEQGAISAQEHASLRREVLNDAVGLQA